MNKVYVVFDWKTYYERDEYPVEVKNFRCIFSSQEAADAYLKKLAENYNIRLDSFLVEEMEVYDV